MAPPSSRTSLYSMCLSLAVLSHIATSFSFVPRSFDRSQRAFVESPPRRSSVMMAAENDPKRVVVIGNGMVGQRFMENLLKHDADKSKCIISTFCEEPRAAYNRVKLTSYFETLDPSSLSMTSEFDEEGRTPWYEENNVELLLNDKAVAMDTEAKTVTGASGKTIPYDVAVFAT
eukprot:15344037-Ditylum_brightwellii.AAC.1